MSKPVMTTEQELLTMHAPFDPIHGSNISLGEPKGLERNGNGFPYRYAPYHCADMVTKRQVRKELKSGRPAGDNGEDVAPWLIVKVRCSGKLHEVALHIRGRIVLLAHDKSEVNALRTLRALGDTSCGCLNAMDDLIAALSQRNPTKRVSSAFKDAISAAKAAHNSRQARRDHGYSVSRSSRYGSYYGLSDMRGYRLPPQASDFPAEPEALREQIAKDARDRYWKEVRRQWSELITRPMQKMVEQMAPWYPTRADVPIDRYSDRSADYASPQNKCIPIKTGKPFIFPTFFPSVVNGSLAGVNTIITASFNKSDWCKAMMLNAHRVRMSSGETAYTASISLIKTHKFDGAEYMTAQVVAFVAVGKFPAPKMPSQYSPSAVLDPDDVLAEMNSASTRCRYERRDVCVVSKVGENGVPLLWMERDPSTY